MAQPQRVGARIETSYRQLAHFRGSWWTILLLVGPSLQVCAAEQVASFTSVGLGGGGAMFVPACSPHDENLMFVSCDMGGVYRTVDGGKCWRMIDARQLRNSKECPVQFHPADKGVVYAVGDGRLRVSRDAGETFEPLINKPPWESQSVTTFAVHPTDAAKLFVGIGRTVFVSSNGGQTWSKSETGKGRALKFVVLRRSSGEAESVFVATSDGIWRSDDMGSSWRMANRGLPWRDVRSLCGGRDGASGETALYCAISSKVVDGEFRGGIYCSRDFGESWQPVGKTGLNLQLGKQDIHGFDDVPQYQFVSAAENRPETVYVTTRGTGSRPPHHFTVFRSDDFGQTWRFCFTPHQNIVTGWIPVDINWHFGGPAIGFGVCSSNSEIVLYSNKGELYVTRSGGRTWDCVYTTRMGAGGDAQRGEAWTSRGLEVTAAWQLAFDPHQSNRAYICYSDIGFARSLDRGKSWRSSGTGSPWRNTWYRIAFDPHRPGVIYAACSNHHDIPHYQELDPARELDPRRRGGGVCISEDFGHTWRSLGRGLPEASATSVIVHRSDSSQEATLYVTMFGYGVYKSLDSGATWEKASQGLGSAENMHVYSLKRQSDGTLLCSITGKRNGSEFAERSGLYRSRDAGQSWQVISPPLKWAGDFDFDPQDNRCIYLTASTAPRHSQGGLYRTTDGGDSWKQVIQEGDLPVDRHRFIHAFSVTVHPRQSQTVYFSSTTHGLFVSHDAGLSWREAQGIPFTAVHSVTIDPADTDVVWVTTHGGGVWKGKAVIQR